MATSKGIVQSVMSIPEYTSDIGIGYRPDTNNSGSAPLAASSPFQQAMNAIMAPGPKTPPVMAPSSAAAPAASGASGSSVSTATTEVPAIISSSPASTGSSSASGAAMVTPPMETSGSSEPSSSGASTPVTPDSGTGGGEGMVPYPIPITKANGTKKIPVVSKSDKQEASRTPDAEQIRSGRPEWLDELMANPNLDHSQFMQKFIYSGMLLPQNA